MPEAIETQIADAVVAELNDPARAFSASFTATREWLPVYTGSELASLKVAVVPLTLETSRRGRGTNELDYGMGINLQKLVDMAVAATAKAAIDALSRVAEQVYDFYLAYHRLNTLSTYGVVGVQRPEIYDLNRLYTESTWETLVILTVRGWR